MPAASGLQKSESHGVGYPAINALREMNAPLLAYR
jgi:hypothetical protein